MERLSQVKLATPRPSRPPIRRPRLVELLSGTLQARLTLVSAPPGFGKTTTLLDWLATANARSAWISLDDTDNDPVRFLRYLWAAVGRLASDNTDHLEEPPEVVDPIEAIGEAISRLPGCPEPVVLVLDDFHCISSPAVQRGVTLLVDRLPACAHLVLATRADPALPLARLRARGELLEVRADTLRFTLDEARRFFADRMGLALSEADLGPLVTRTEGWPAVLQLAGLALAGRPDVEQRVRDFAASHRFVLDYVVEEVLAGLSVETQDFLLRTSVLERLCGPLCEAVTGKPDGQARLEALERANLLIIPLDEERRWYRYHALFAEILRARLRTLHPDDVAPLHARASAWHEAAGDDEAAIAHALRAGDTERAARIIGDVSLRHLNAGELGTIRRWLDALPPEVVRDHPQLSASYAWCLALNDDADGLAERLADVERALAAGRDAGPFARPMLPAQLALLRNRLATLQGDTPTAIAQARRARELVPAGLPAAAEATLRGDATVLLGNALWNAGDTAGAADAYRASLPDLRAGGNVFAVGRAIADLAAIAIAQGDAEGALRLCEAELAGSAPSGSAAASPAVWAALARARAELGQADLAEEAARHALELAGRVGDAPSAGRARWMLEQVARLRADRPSGASVRRVVEGPDGPVEALSQRELEVLWLVSLGRSNSQIAGELFVTVGTVKSHLHTISGKLGAANRVEAVARGRELGLLG